MTHLNTCPQQEQIADVAFALQENSPRTSKSDAVLSHARACETCRKLLEQYRNVIELAQRALVRQAPNRPTAECLNEDTLAGYVDGVLKPREQDLAERHMARCIYCLNRLVELSKLMSQATAPGLVEFVLGIAGAGLRLLTYPEEGFALLRTEPVPVLDTRPADTGKRRKVQTWTQQLDDITVTFSAVHVDAMRVSLTLRAARGSAPLAGAQLTLCCGGLLVQSQPLPEEGATTLENLEPNPYECSISDRTGQEIAFALILRAEE